VFRYSEFDSHRYKRYLNKLYFIYLQKCTGGVMNTDQPINLNERSMQPSAGNRKCNITLILNQVSSVFLFALIPVLLWVYSLSLKSIYSFSYARFLTFQTLTGQLLSMMTLITFTYHAAFRIRSTLMDMRIGHKFGYDRISVLIGVGIFGVIAFYFYG
jgi:succinate dehydrogenase cytochrome b556 subunit